MKGLGLILAAFLVVGMATEAVSQPPHWATTCVKGWKDYKKKPGHKAFAQKQSNTADNFHCGYAWKAGSVASAKEGALKACAHKACYVTDSE